MCSTMNEAKSADFSYPLNESRAGLRKSPGCPQVELLRTLRNQVGEWRDLLDLGNPVMHVVQEVHPELTRALST